MVLFLVALFAAPAVSGQASSPPPIVVEGKKQKKICKTYDAPTGSHIGEQQICKTKAEWDLEEAAAERNMSRENLRTNAVESQRYNEQNGLVGKKPL